MLVCDSANQREAPDFIRHEALLRNMKFFACGKSEAFAAASADVMCFRLTAVVITGALQDTHCQLRHLFNKALCFGGGIGDTAYHPYLSVLHHGGDHPRC